LALAELLAADEAAAWGRLVPGGVEVLEVHGPREVRPWASVSKLAAALAVHVAIEDGSLPGGEGLGAYGLAPLDLLAHAAGLPGGEASDPRLADPGAAVPSVAPGTRRIYSNLGYELLGRGVAAVTGEPFSEYLREAVLAPLAMHTARVQVSEGLTGAAFGVVGGIEDLVGLVRGLAVPGIVAAETLGAMVTPRYPELEGVLPGFGHQRPNPWGLGPELRGQKSPHWTSPQSSLATFGHFGQSGSFVWLDPEAGAWMAYLGPRPFGPWAKERWPVLATQVLALAS
jgi:CubicO group peptidase (beta-lactamase class C family)